MAATAAHIDTQLDFERGKEFARTIDLDVVRASEFVEFLDDGADVDDEELRESLTHLADQLEQAAQGLWRDHLILDVGAWTVYAGGGTSWGDSPGPTFDAINRAWMVPGLLESIGFGWPERGKPKVVKPEFTSNDAEIEWLTEQLGRHVEFATEEPA